jgi:hypothetical protein
VRGRREEALGLWTRALDTARAQPDRATMFEAAYRVLIWAVPQRWSRHVALAGEFSACPRDGVGPRVVGNLLQWCAATMLAEGDRERFEEVLHASIEAHVNGYAAGAYVMNPARESVVCTLDGRFEERCT